MSKYSTKVQLAENLVWVCTLALIGIPVILMGLVPNPTFKLVMMGVAGVGVIGVIVFINKLTKKLRQECARNDQERNE